MVGNDSPLLLKPPLKLMSLKGKPWSEFAKTLTENVMQPVSGNDKTNQYDQFKSTIVGRKVILTKEMIGRLQALPSTLPLIKSCGMQIFCDTNPNHFF